LRALLPALSGLRILDLGCGYGWFCRWARDAGAAEVGGGRDERHPDADRSRRRGCAYPVLEHRGELLPSRLRREPGSVSSENE
jgi:SAM-dependent methyltransferase